MGCAARGGVLHSQCFMKLSLVKHHPRGPLADFVESFVYVEGNNRGAGFPKTAMSLVFNLGDGFKLFHDSGFTEFTDYRKHWVAGLQTKPSYVESYGTSRMVVVQFRTLGASVFLQRPSVEFSDHYVPLDCVFGREADETWERLQEAATIADKFAVTSDFLLGKLTEKRLANRGLLREIDSRLSADGRVTVEAICKEHRISRKHLNYLFKDSAGVSPKTLASLHRFQKILKSITQSRPRRLTDFAQELDYFDQAHFNNDFKRFTRLNPSQYLKLAAAIPSMRAVPHFLPVL
jgi:AraC-like DNA-binding protein